MLSPLHPGGQKGMVAWMILSDSARILQGFSPASHQQEYVNAESSPSKPEAKVHCPPLGVGLRVCKHSAEGQLSMNGKQPQIVVSRTSVAQVLGPTHSRSAGS